MRKLYLSAAMAAALTVSCLAQTTPSNPVFSNPTVSSLQLSWGPSTGTFQGYRFDLSTDPSFATFVIQARDTVRDTTSLIINLSPCRTYYARVRAYGPFSPYSTTATGSTACGNGSDTVPPGVPGNLTVTSIAQSGFTISWNPSTDNVGVAGYLIDVARDAQFLQRVPGWAPFDTGLNTVQAVYLLESGTTYYVRVSAYDAQRNRSAAASTQLTTNPAPPAPNVAASSVRAVVIGDFGLAGPAEAALSQIVHGLNPDLILTVGDNNYEYGLASTIDANIGQYFRDYIFPYKGTYGPGASTNRFFPTLGNHDMGAPYSCVMGNQGQPQLDYFSLPNNQRYYDFVWGPVHFFAINSDCREPDGRDSNSKQAQWLQARMAASTKTLKVVYMHHPAYSIDPATVMRWPFHTWGATAVLAGHVHRYERFLQDGIPYITIGDGLSSGSLLLTASGNKISFSHYNRQGVPDDNFSVCTTCTPDAPASLQVVTSNSRIDLTWRQTSAPVSTFTIKRGIAPGGPYQIIATSVTTPSYADMDPSLNRSTRYYYVVSATNQNGESGNSNEVSAIPPWGVTTRRPDVFWQNDATGHTTVWHMGGNQGTSLTAWNSITTATGSDLAASADFNRDGVRDLVWQHKTSRQITIWFMGGSQTDTLTASSIVAAAPGWTIVGAADFNADTRPDLVLQNDSTRQATIWYMGGAQGTSITSWAWLHPTGVPGWKIAAIADFNGDHKPDLVWQNDATRAASLWYMTGAQGTTMASWTWLSASGTPGWTIVGAADFDADATPDVVWQNDTTRQATIWYMTATGTVRSWNWLMSSPNPGWRISAVH